MSPRTTVNKKRKRRESSSDNASDTSSSSGTNSTSSSDNSSNSSNNRRRTSHKRKSSSRGHSSRKVENRKLKKRILVLEDKLQSRYKRFEGKIDSISVFKGGLDGLTAQQWLHSIESTGDLFEWDEKAKIFCMANRLAGHAKHWYNNQEELNISWSEWKFKLLNAFPSHTSYYSKLKELVNDFRDKDRNLIDFFYKKLSLGHSCNLQDKVIIDIVINTLNDPFLKSSAKAANCRDTNELLKFLILNNDNNYIRVKTMDANSNHFRKQSSNKINKLICFLCKKEGHKKGDCPCNKSIKQCNFCKLKGHLEQDCFKKQKTFDKGNTSKQVIRTVICGNDDSGNEKFYKFAKINNNVVSVYVDFGSGCNTIKLDVVNKLGLVRSPDKINVTIEGYGGANVVPLGLIKQTLEIDEIKTETDFYIVPNNLQEVDIIIGRPVTEKQGVLVFKSSSVLKLSDNVNFLKQLPNYIEHEERLKFNANNEVIIRPGINLICVKANIETESLHSNYSEQEHSGVTLVIPQHKINFYNGKGYLRILNTSLNNVIIEENTCLARSAQCKPMIDTIANNNIKQKLEDVLAKYPKAFGENDALLSNIDTEMTIELTTSVPVSSKPYRLSIYEREQVREIVEDLMEKSIIEPANSPYSSPIILLKKKNGSTRMVVDYRKLNSITVKDRFPLPLIEDQLERINGSKVFTTLDLKSGYHQISMAPESRKYTAFVTPDGHYQYTRVAFGLCNAPAVFQRAINLVLGQLRHSYALVYLDDILIVSTTIDQGLERLNIVLQALNSAGLTLNLAKCEFLKSSVEYLGVEISNGELRPSSRKIEAVEKFPKPRNVHQTRQFIGLASYFRKYIKDFALKAAPLTSLLKKNAPWRWDVEQIRAFERLKQELISSPTLAAYNSQADTQLHTDASKIGIGGALLQKQEDNKWKPVAYMSRQTTDPETRYHSFELETLAVFEAIKRFRNYLFGKKFVIITDCSAIRLTWSKKDMSPRVGRWWLALQEYDFTIEHRPGTKMLHVDALSRNPIHINVMNTKDWIYAVQVNDEDTQLIRRQVLNNEAPKDYTVVDDKVCKIINGEPKIFIPRDLRWRVTKMHHDDNGHPGWQRALDSIRETYWFVDMKNFVKKFVTNCIACMTNKRPTGKRKIALHPIEKVAIPFHTLHMDHLGPFCKSPLGNAHILVIIDGFTKFVWLEAVPDTGSLHVCNTVEQLIKLVHPPKRIITDRGKGFHCRMFEAFCKKYDVKHVKNAIASPRSNGQVERLNRTILESLSASIDDEQDGWDKYLIQVQKGINSTRNATTGFAPAEMLYGMRPELQNEYRLSIAKRKDLTEVRKLAKKRCDDLSIKMKTRFDKNKSKPNIYNVGDQVLVERTLLVKGLSSGKLVPKYIGPVKITEVLGNDRYRVVSLSKDKRRFKGVIASEKLKLFKPQNVELP